MSEPISRPPAEREQAWVSIGPALSRYAHPGARVAIVCLSADRQRADRESRDLAMRLDGIGIDTGIRLWAGESEWYDFDSGEPGPQTDAAREYVAAVMAPTGRAPVASREALGSSLVGDRTPIAELLPEARKTAGHRASGSEARWAAGRLQKFHARGESLTDRDAARLLVALDSIPIRDRLWDDMSPDNAASHVVFWIDLTRRAPDDVRAASASLLAFANWLSGDGAQA